MRCGVVCFSPCLQSVLLVKTEEFSWTFPYAKISSSSFPAANLEGAIATLKHLTGVQLNDADLQANRWIQVDGEAVSGLQEAGEGPVKLFIACGVEPDDHQLSAAAPAIDVQWWPWASVVEAVSGSDTHPPAMSNERHGIGASAGAEIGASTGHTAGTAGQGPGTSHAADCAAGSPPAQDDEETADGAAPSYIAMTAMAGSTSGATASATAGGAASEPSEHAPKIADGTLGAEQGLQLSLTHSRKEFAALAPFMPELLQLLQRSPQLRVQEADQELLSLLQQLLPHLQPQGGSTAAGAGAGSSEAGGAGELAASGPGPKEFLEEYCREHNLPAPCYSLIVKKSSNRNITLGSCILPHLGVQITPDEVLQYKEVPGGGTVNLARPEAEQVAALFALLYIEGVLAVHTEWARVVPVGFPPLLRPHQLRGYDSMVQRKSAWLDSQKTVLLQRLDQKRQKLEAELAALSKTALALESGASYEILKTSELRAVLAGALGTTGPNPLPPSGRQPRPAKRARTTATATTPPVSASTTSTSVVQKSRIQELKEFCDRHKWQKPEYICTEHGPEQGSSGFTCTLQLPGPIDASAVQPSAQAQAPAATGISGEAQGTSTGASQQGIAPTQEVEPKIRVTSKPAPNKRKAKEGAAQLALQQLAELGL